MQFYHKPIVLGKIFFLKIFLFLAGRHLLEVDFYLWKIMVRYLKKFKHLFLCVLVDY
jgi:hypothetical protein